MTPVFPLTKTSFGTYQRYLSALAGNTASSAAVEGFDLLTTQVLDSNTSTITFSGLYDSYAADYDHLQLRISARCTSTSPARVGVMRFGAGASDDSGSNYTNHDITGNGSTIASSANVSATEIRFSNYIAHTGDTNGYGVAVVDILDAFSGSKYKTIRAIAGNVGQQIMFNGGSWKSTSAINRISYGVGGTWNLTLGSGSRFSLYGIRGAN